MQSGVTEIDHYCAGVLSGDIPAGEWVHKSVRRFVSDLAKQKTNGFPYYFEPKAAQHFFDFCESELTQYEGVFSGRPLALEPWQKFVFGNIFGWLKVERLAGNPVRRFREAIIEIPKKQGKSILAAAIGLYLIWWDNVPGAQVYGLAKNRSHAEKLSYRSARAMVKKNERLIKQFRVNESAANIGIYNDDADSFFSPLTSKPESTDGLNIHGAINDETKDWEDFEIYNIVKDGTISMYNSLILNITTAGHNQNSLGFERRGYLCKILDGVIPDQSTFGVIYGIDKGDEERWDCADVWAKAMPNYGVSVFAEALEAKVLSCKNSPSQKNSFLVKHLNVWLSSEDGFITSERWDTCNKSGDIASGEMADVSEWARSYSGRRAWAGLDMGTVSDFASCVFVVEPKKKGGQWDVLPMFWIPADTVNDRKNKDIIQAFVDGGWVKTTDGDVTDFETVEYDIKAMCSHLNVQEVAYDRYKLDQMVQNLEKDGILVVSFGQGYVSMAPAVDQLEKAVLSAIIDHHGNPVLRWMNSNVVITKDPAGNRKFAKDKTQDKIDGMVSLAMALARAMLAPVEDGSPYDQHGVRGFSISW
jgi:phage terminase large subunit-like protein